MPTANAESLNDLNQENCCCYINKWYYLVFICLQFFHFKFWYFRVNQFWNLSFWKYQLCNSHSLNFKVNESAKFQVPQISVNKIPDEKTRFLRVDGFNPKNNNSLITNYYQLGLGTMHKYMLLEVGCQIMEEPVFDTLRTKEQLGYSVFSMLRNTHGIIGLSITVNTQVI